MSREYAELKTSPCQDCGGTGWEVVDSKGARPCRCKLVGHIELLLAQARIPKRYEHCSFASFEAFDMNLQRALAKSKRYVTEFAPGEAGLLYLGNPGVGKTHMAVSVLKGLIEKGFPGLFCDFRDLLKEIQDSYNPSTKTSELQVLAPIIEAEILVLDELGASRPTEWVQETVAHIINRRYNDKKVTIFTSNYLDIRPSQAPRSFEPGKDAPHNVQTHASMVKDETLADRIGARMRSRLYEMCKQIVIEGVPDHRELSRSRMR